MPCEMENDFNFSHHKVIKDFVSMVPSGGNKCQSLVAYGQDIFYLWNGRQCQVHAVNVKRCLRDHVWDDQVVLRPKRQPLFEVERLLLNSSCTLLSLQGPRGVAVLHLPEVCEKDTNFGLICVSLAERLFQGEQHVLRCARWHPGSPTDSHLVMLTSDEVLRCYNALNGQLLWSCLMSKHAVVSHISIPGRVTLGDSPVNFDFVLPSAACDPVPAEWPVLVLWGNGNIFHVSTTLTSEKPTVSGPLLMNPPSDDNYGSDACSLVVLNSSPPVVVLSTCTGTLYHSLLMPSEEGEQIENSNELCLCVVEAVELDLGLILGDDPDIVSCPVNLVPDPVELSRYYCIHAGGIHSVTIPLVTKLYEFTEDAGSDFSAFKMKSVVEYLLGTAVYSRSSYECSPLLGAAFVDLTMSLYVILSDGKLVEVKISPKTLYSIQNLMTEKIDPSNGKGLQYAIENILKEGGIAAHQPTIKLPPNTSAEAWLELILRTTQILTSVLKTHEKISFQLVSRADAAFRAISDQKNDLALLLSERTRLQETAETIAEKYEEMNERLGSLNVRMEEVIKCSYGEGFGLTQKERNVAESFQNLEKKIERFDLDMKRIRATCDYQNSTTKETVKALSNNRAFYIDDSKIRSIREQLRSSSNDILMLHRRVENMKTIMMDEGLIK